MIIARLKYINVNSLDCYREWFLTKFFSELRVIPAVDLSRSFNGRVFKDQQWRTIHPTISVNTNNMKTILTSLINAIKSSEKTRKVGFIPAFIIRQCSSVLILVLFFLVVKRMYFDVPSWYILAYSLHLPLSIYPTASFSAKNPRSWIRSTPIHNPRRNTQK